MNSGNPPDTDTIAAIATPPGRGGVGIVRVSGPLARQIAQKVFGRCPPVRQATFGKFLDASGQVIDEGIALFFQAPASYTGEDVLELQGHGGTVVLQLVLDAVLAAGARLAKPGEFTERAFLNNKLDLTQAEAVSDLICATTIQAARSAMRSLQGEFSRVVDRLLESLIALRMYIEAAIDFPEEEIDFLSDQSLHQRVDALLDEVRQTLQCAQQGARLQEGITVVIAGRPNAGKSSLLNALCGKDAAIVTEIAGTTRDIVRENLHLGGVPMELIDTAGLRATSDVVEKIGVARARHALTSADLVLVVIDASHEQPNDLDQYWRDVIDGEVTQVPKIWVFNKIDTLNAEPKKEEVNDTPVVWLSAKTGMGLDLLKQTISDVAGVSTMGETPFMARTRHIDALRKTQSLIERARVALVELGAGELAAEDLRQAQQALSEITGEFTSDDLLGRIFSSFCIGK
ncbi:MAG: tRNA uridine-5-carboxymethylaminomethyl(34) synthesis GTPase MnmE [Gammaproteobacteria bacterium]|nr:MAG: tRNA uridine-5-carboxymethylaminomethyl(34) synthesis GTPase MnmE [Gammaproteobacteria bacterium]